MISLALLLECFKTVDSFFSEDELQSKFKQQNREELLALLIDMRKNKLVECFTHPIFEGSFWRLYRERANLQPNASQMSELEGLIQWNVGELNGMISAQSEGLLDGHSSFVDALKVRHEQWELKHTKTRRKKCLNLK